MPAAQVKTASHLHTLHYTADIFNAVKISLETVMQCLCWSFVLFHKAFFFFFFNFHDMWTPTKTCMKIPQGLFKNTPAQISVSLFQIYQIWGKSGLFKKIKINPKIWNYLVVEKQKWRFKHLVGIFVICMAVQIFAIYLLVVWLLLFSIVPTFFCNSLFKEHLNWALQICSFAQFKNLRACLKP